MRVVEPTKRAVPGRASRWLVKAVVIFVLAWAVISLGLAVVRIEAENYTVRIRTPAAAAQTQRGDQFSASLPAIEARLPRSADVLVVWVGSTPGFPVGADIPNGSVWWAYSVGNYWLYPRRVFVTTDPAEAITTNVDAVIVVRLPSDKEPAVASGLSQTAQYASSIQVVTLYSRSGPP